MLPKEAKGKGVIGKLSGQVGRFLREGKHPKDIKQHFQQQYQPAATMSSIKPETKDTVKLPSRT